MQSIVLVTIAVLVVSPATAQTDFPTRAVRIIVPYAPGGVVDITLRVLGDALARQWGRPVVIENRPGGGTITGTAMVAKSDPDGYTLGVATSPFLVNPSLRPNLPYDSLRDFTGVSMLVSQSVTILAHPSFAANNVPELVAEAKKRAEPFAYGSAGTAGISHLTGELLQRAAGVKLIHVPYNGAGKALPDLLSGQIPLMFDPGFSARPFVESGQIKVLGISSKERLPILPQVATIGETYPGFEATSVQALIAPAGVPPDVLAKLSAAVQAIVRSPEFATKVTQSDLEPIASTPAEFNAFARRETAKWKQVISEANIKGE
jgi:tripartite-type tricarboxylate transporter receptor subunit TctC